MANQSISFTYTSKLAHADQPKTSDFVCKDFNEWHGGAIAEDGRRSDTVRQPMSAARYTANELYGHWTGPSHTGERLIQLGNPVVNLFKTDRKDL